MKLKTNYGKVVTGHKKATDAGAIGGKLLGAGGGGFLLFLVEPDKQKLVKSALKDVLNVPFNFDFSGSQIVYYSESGYF